ncbi:PilZ domain-containing protein [Catenovulum maritimum]|uniref:Flagellar brake protein n=1 Tax=Catenovulum maritimum TaxID=1513271 RepID=A0A0J8GWD7_9ALTE|nr:PilZ domain-containing protein [Catenovulum maritimum]KMT67067.1 hypothetical protein XM47_00275 [Catenovulum maritimum]
MLTTPVEFNTLERLSRNLGLLQAGSIVTVEISTPSGQKIKFRSIFIGYLPKKYALVQLPESSKIGNISQYIVPDAAVTVRGLQEGHEGSVAAFVSSIKQVLKIPSRIMVLNFPQTVSVQSLRKAVRIDTDIATKLEIADKQRHGMITDISISGCQLMIKEAAEVVLERGDKLHLLIENFIENEKLEVECVTCSYKKIGDDISLGLKFDTESKKQAIKLINYIIIHEEDED